MIGCRPLTDEEINQILTVLERARDKAIFILGLRTGFRVSELLSLSIKDVYQFGRIVDSVTVQCRNMKGAHSSRTVPLHQDAKDILLLLVQESPDAPSDAALFRGQKSFTKSITRFQVHKILSEAFDRAELSGKVASHSMRKTFASKVYQKLNKDLVSTQKALGHKSIGSTVSYLSFDQDAIDAAILA